MIDLKKRNSNDESRNNEQVDLIDLKLTFNTYLPCCALNAHLVLKDWLKLDQYYTKLIQKISKDIVSKHKV